MPYRSVTESVCSINRTNWRTSGRAVMVSLKRMRTVIVAVSKSVWKEIPVVIRSHASLDRRQSVLPVPVVSIARYDWLNSFHINCVKKSIKSSLSLRWINKIYYSLSEFVLHSTLMLFNGLSDPTVEVFGSRLQDFQRWVRFAWSMWWQEWKSKEKQN